MVSNFNHQAAWNMTNIVCIAVEAGQQIVDVYHSADLGIQVKEDDSPVTLADQKAHQTIMRRLAEITPEWPVLSEEGEHEPYAVRKEWEYFWLVDPLDGTKEFIKGKHEFTVNIALIHCQYPVLGVIYAPLLNELYFAQEGIGAYKWDQLQAEDIERLVAKQERNLLSRAQRLPLRDREDLCVVVSRSHMSAETEQFMQHLQDRYGEVQLMRTGSSLKFCKVAEGTAHIYPRFAPIMEWDTGAGQALVEQAGGQVMICNEHGEEQRRLHYNRQNLVNPSFIVRNKKSST